MTQQDTRPRQAAAFAALAVAAAVLCRVFSRCVNDIFWSDLGNFVRIFLYLGFFALWGVSVRRRVIQAQARRYLLAAAGLMIFWLAVRELRWHLVLHADARRWLWYLYYVPLLLIPLLALLVALSLGRGEAYRLPRRTALLFAATAALIALVLTNDLHQWVFSFPEAAVMRSETDYAYGFAYYLVSAWALLCSLAAFAVMLTKCRVPRPRRLLWLPLLPFGAAVVYAVLYLLRVPFVLGALGDLTVLYCLFFAAFFESCIACGLIQSNTRYFDLFRASVGSSAQITDANYVVRYAASGAETLPREAMAEAETAPVLLPGGKRLHSMPVNGGHVVWTEDISELLRLRETLESRREELQDRSGFLRCEYEKEKEHRLVAEQNRLYDLLQSRTQSQLDRIRRLAEDCHAARSAEERRRILAHIVVLGTFIKRRKDLVLSADAAPALPESVLESAFNESFRSLALLGVRGGCLVRTGRSELPAEAIARAYDFFECVLEASLGEARFLRVSVGAPQDVLRCAVSTDSGAGRAEILLRWPDAKALDDGDGGEEYRLPLEGGAAQ